MSGNYKLFMFPHARDPVASNAYCVGNLGEVPLKISKVTIVICWLVFALAACFGQAPASDTSLSKNTIFQKNCAKCHGKTAEGRHFGGPSLISDKVSSADDLRRIITNGKGRMPRYASKLTSEEIDTLVLEIETLNKR
jgi:mono/diheme cytochrome c family protein